MKNYEEFYVDKKRRDLNPDKYLPPDVEGQTVFDFISKQWQNAAQSAENDTNEGIKKLIQFHKAGMRLSVALRHDMLFHLKKIRLPPTYNIYEILFEKSATCPRMLQRSILQHRLVEVSYVKSFIDIISHKELSYLRKIMRSKWHVLPKLKGLVELRDAYLCIDDEDKEVTDDIKAKLRSVLEHVLVGEPVDHREVHL